jgi:Macrocin-O-methyltransferase (TylF)
LPEQEGIWHKGQFACSLEHVKENLAPWPNIELVPGWFDQVLTENLRKSFEPVSLVHIDCDIYSATVTVLKWIRKLIKPGTIFVFDEWPISEGRAWMKIMEDVEVEEIITSQQRIHRVTRGYLSKRALSWALIGCRHMNPQPSSSNVRSRSYPVGCCSKSSQIFSADTESICTDPPIQGMVKIS